MTLDEATKLAQTIVPYMIDLADSFDHMIIEDHWCVISPTWDLNIFWDEEAKRHRISLYKVKDGCTDTTAHWDVRIRKGLL